MPTQSLCFVIPAQATIRRGGNPLAMRHFASPRSGRYNTGVKRHLRQHIRQLLAGISADDLLRRSRSACDRLGELPVFQRARSVLLYLPIEREVDCSALARAAWAAGKTVLAPTACDHCRSMRTILCPPDHEDLFHPAHGLRQPDRNLGEVDPASIDLVVAPGLAYDRRGNRLGRGGGFYDRFLARPDLHAQPVGLALAEQILDHVPAGPDDQPVASVVTDREVIHCTHPPAATETAP